MKLTFPIQWHITDACDQRCRHCYIYAEGFCPSAPPTIETLHAVFDECMGFCAQNNRAPYFYLTGGDPLLHPAFWQLAELLCEHQVMWAVMGNPFHLTPEVCTRLKELGCRKYQLSLDGLRETHDSFRMPGSFDATLRALPLLRDAGIWTAVMTTVSSVNLHEVPDLIDLMAQLEVDVYAFARYCPTSGQRRDEFHVDPLDYRAFLLRCQERILAHEAAGCRTTFQRKDHLWRLLEYEQGRFVIPADAVPGMIYDGCHCATGHVTITPDGDVYACRRMDSKAGNIHESSLQDLFMGAPMEQFRDFDRFEKCNTCELFSWCRGCPAVAAGYTGNMYAPDPQCWKEVDPT